MFEKLMDRHKNPWNMFFHLLTFVVGIYGIWHHNWTWIIVAIILAIIGHLFPYKKKSSKGKNKKVVKEKENL